MLTSFTVLLMIVIVLAVIVAAAVFLLLLRLCISFELCVVAVIMCDFDDGVAHVVSFLIFAGHAILFVQMLLVS